MHRVGILPFQMQDSDIAVLFVTSQTRGRWILPKGRVKKKETHEEACHREAFEEAGIRGTVLNDYPITVVVGRQTESGIEQIPVTYYPFFVQEQSDKWPERKQRERHWSLLKDAKKIVYREDFLDLIERLDELAPWIKKAAKECISQRQAELKLAQ